MFLVSVCGFSGLHNFDPLVLHMERLVRNLHSEFCGALLRPAVFSVLLTRKYPERVRQVLDFARMAGEELVKLGSVTATTLQAVAEDICTPEELMTTANAYWDRELGGPADEPA